MVGAVRFELTTSCTRNRRATRLRYAPNQKRAEHGKHTGVCKDKSHPIWGQAGSRKAGSERILSLESASSGGFLRFPG